LLGTYDYPAKKKDKNDEKKELGRTLAQPPTTMFALNQIVIPGSADVSSAGLELSVATQRAGGTPALPGGGRMVAMPKRARFCARHSALEI
jgi:hypothetical protein